MPSILEIWTNEIKDLKRRVQNPFCCIGLSSATAGEVPTADGQGGISFQPGGTGTAISLTTTGSSGAATLVSGTLNIPVYSSGSSTFLTLGVTKSSASTLTLAGTNSYYVYTASTATTWTLPAGVTGATYFIKNQGSGVITLSGASNIYKAASLSSVTINPGEGYQIFYDGTLWNLI